MLARALLGRRGSRGAPVSRPQRRAPGRPCARAACAGRRGRGRAAAGRPGGCMRAGGWCTPGYSSLRGLPPPPPPLAAAAAAPRHPLLAPPAAGPSCRLGRTLCRAARSFTGQAQAAQGCSQQPHRRTAPLNRLRFKLHSPAGTAAVQTAAPLPRHTRTQNNENPAASIASISPLGRPPLPHAAHTGPLRAARGAAAHAACHGAPLGAVHRPARRGLPALCPAAQQARPGPLARRAAPATLLPATLLLPRPDASQQRARALLPRSAWPARASAPARLASARLGSAALSPACPARSSWPA